MIINPILRKIFLEINHPIGSVYISVSSKSPEELFGGSWERIAKGRTLVGVDIDDTDFNTVEKVGGNKKLQAHNHLIQVDGINVQLRSGFATGGNGRALSLDGTVNGNTSTSTYGEGNSGNLQPYFTVYIWKRIA